MLQQDIENDSIIGNQISNQGCLVVCTFDNFLVPLLVAAHTVNNFDIGDDKVLKMRAMKVLKQAGTRKGFPSEFCIKD